MAEVSKGVVGALIAGVGALILVVIITLMIISTIDDAKLLRSTATTTTVYSETGAYFNSTGYTLSVESTNPRNRNYAIVTSVNASNGVTIVDANYTTADSDSGLYKNGTVTNWNLVNVTYTYIAPTNYEETVTGASRNLTKGIDNVSTKIPTILLIGAVVLLFGVIVLLVRQAQSMGMGGQKGSSL